MTRISPNTISEESSRTGTARRSRRATYLYMRRVPPAYPASLPRRARLLIEPGPGEGGRPVAVAAPQGAGGRVSHVRLEGQEAVVVGHPHPQHLVVLPIDDLLGDRALLGAIGRLPELGRQLVDHGILDAEEVLGRLRVHVVIRPLVQADRVTGLEAP